jgi:hypothetical protein
VALAPEEPPESGAHHEKSISTRVSGSLEKFEIPFKERHSFDFHRTFFRRLLTEPKPKNNFIIF